MIKARKLTKRFFRNTIITDVDLDIPEGSVYCLAGLNGAGKTTVMSILASTSKPSSGQVFFKGTDISRMRDYQGHIGYFPQDSALPRMRLGDAMQYLAAMRGLGKQKANSEIAEFLSYFRMEHRLRMDVLKLSHGQRKLAAIVQAFFGEPEIVYLDEPFAGLDPLHKRMLKRFMADKRTTLVINTHLLDEVEGLCTDIGIIHHGKLISQSKAKRYRKPLKDVFLNKLDDVVGE